MAITKSKRSFAETLLMIIKDQRFIMFLVLVALMLFFGTQSRRYFSAFNIYNMLRQASMVIIVGTGATLLMMTSCFDLSTGSIVGLSGVTYALLGSVFGWPLYQAAIVCVLIGLFCGVITGTLVSRFNIPAFIGSLGMMYIVRGVALVLTDGMTIKENMPEGWNTLGRGTWTIVDFGKWSAIPIPVYIMLLSLIIFIFVGKKTLLGRYAMAVGGNKNAAFYSGINEKRVIFILYVIVGGLAAFAGCMFASRTGIGDPRAGMGFEFDVIVAILLGGTNINGGKGTIIGLFLGAMVVTVIGNGLNMLGILSFWQQIVKGIILVIAIVMNEQLSGENMKNLIKRILIKKPISS